MRDGKTRREMSNNMSIMQDSIHSALVPAGDVCTSQAAIRKTILHHDSIAQVGTNNVVVKAQYEETLFRLCREISVGTPEFNEIESLSRYFN